MRALVAFGFAFALVAGPTSSRAALDASSPIVCAMVDVFDCSGEGCVEVDSRTVGVPALLRVDANAKTMRALDLETVSNLDSVGAEESKLVARALSGDRSLLLAVDQATGDAILTVSDLKLTLVGYGECAKD
jgi:hypothetical protein